MMRILPAVLLTALLVHTAQAVDHSFTILSVNRIDTSAWQARDFGDVSETVWVTVEYRRDATPVDTLGFMLPSEKPADVPEVTYDALIKRLIKKRIRGLLEQGVGQTDITPPLGRAVLGYVGVSATLKR